MAKIKDQENATPAPSPEAKQAMDAAWESLKDALADIALSDFAAAADSVGDAAKQLQDVINDGTANSDPLQQILGSLGISPKPAGTTPAQKPQTPKPVASGGGAGGGGGGSDGGGGGAAGGAGSGGGSTGGSDAAPSLSDRVPLPPVSQMNTGLSSCTETTMLKKFGKPGELTEDCSTPTGTFLARVRKNFNVGPFKVTGLDYAVESLLQVFTDVKNENPQLFNQVKNEGMLCVRARRHNPSHYSNHSWGTAIDIFFGTEVVDQGVKLTNRGNLLLAPYFNRHGWYWGAGFSGDSVDSMHFELAEETIAKIPDGAMFDAGVAFQDTAGGAAPAGTGGFQADPASKKLLGDILTAVNSATAIRQSFAGVAYAATLPGGQLLFQSELQLDTDGWPGGNQGDNTWQPDTLNYTDRTPIHANEVPYFVLPGNWYSKFGIKLGDLAAVIYKGKLAFAVFADVGPKTKLGEGSLELLRQLGEERLRPNGKVINAGMGDSSRGDYIVTVVFPGSTAASYQNQSALLDFIKSRAQLAYLKLGGNLPSELS
jgi:hypothetical protein